MSRGFILYLVVVTFRSLALMALAGIFSTFVRNVAIRHAIWAVTACSILLLPAADALLPAVFVPESLQQVVFESSVQALLVLSPAPSPAIAAPSVPSAGSAPAGARYSTWDWALMIYAAVTLWLLFRTGNAHLRVRRLTRRGVPIKTAVFDEMLQTMKLGGATKLLQADVVRVPLTVGFLNPVILLPGNWNCWHEWNLRAVLAHELTHVRRADWLITAMAGLNRSVFWFNPFSWWLERHLGALAEQASDEASLSLIGDAPRYAEVLLGFAAEAQDGRRLAGGMAMARRNIRTRIDRILALQHPQSGVLRRAGWIALMIAAMPVIYLAAAVQNAPPRATPREPARVERTTPPQQAPRTTSEPKAQEPAKPEQEPIEKIFEEAIRAKDLSPYYQDLFKNNEALQRQMQKDVWAIQENLFKDGLAHHPGAWNAQLQMPDNIKLPPNSYAFFVSGPQDGAISFRRGEGTTWNSVSYGCDGCSFFASDNGIGPESIGGQGILLKMEKQDSDDALAGDLTITCRARECWAMQVSNGWPTPTARFKFDVAKLDGLGEGFSQVLIIVSR